MAEQTALNSAPVSQASSATSDVVGKSSGDILSMINGSNQAPSPQPVDNKVDNNVPKTDSKVIDPKLVDPNVPPVPDKFKKEDGSLDVNRLLSSYLEAEKSLSKTMNVAHEGKTAMSELEMYKQLAQDFKSQIDQLKTQPQDKNQDSEYSEEEIKLIQENPRAWLKQELAKELQSQSAKQLEESTKQREQDYMMLTAINKARETLPAFSALEPEIKQLAEQSWVGNDPKAVEDLYYSAIGRKNEALVQFASKKAYDEGYNKAKQDLQMQVDGGGKDSAPVDASSTLEAARNATTEELGKMLPRSRND